MQGARDTTTRCAGERFPDSGRPTVVPLSEVRRLLIRRRGVPESCRLKIVSLQAWCISGACHIARQDIVAKGGRGMVR